MLHRVGSTYIILIAFTKIVFQPRCILKPRDNIDQNNYKLLDKCTNVSNLTSVLKLFLRELPTPLIPRKVINDFKKSGINPWARCDPQSVVLQLRTLLESIDDYSYRVLRYILLHSKRVADDKGVNY